MKLLRSALGKKIVFPFLDVVAEGRLHAVDRTGYMMVTDAVVEGEPADTLLLPIPDWVRILD